jgi:TetR/AcrR family transcriptional regulator, regulator of autoinduction and epiphytic fitness
MPGRVKRRTYVSPARRAQADATRRRILDAAASLFLERGYARTTTASIALEARTSEATVFAVFGTKANLMVSVIADQVGRQDFPLKSDPIWLVLAANSDKRPAVEHMARVVRAAHDRSWRLLATAWAAAEDDPEAARAARRGADSRHDDAAWFVRDVIGIGDPEAGPVIDAVWTLVSVENYRHLVVERSWEPERYEAWLAAMVAAVLG